MLTTLDVGDQALVGLHSLSHVIQSLLMRIQADVYVLKQITSKQAAHKHPTEQYFERCKQSVLQASGLLDTLFKMLYLSNETYTPELETLALPEWWDKIVEELGAVSEDITFSLHPSISAASKNLLLTLDFSLLRWMILNSVRTIGQWQKHSTGASCTLSQVHGDKLELHCTFQPVFNGNEGDPANPQNEAYSLGALYWAFAQHAAALLHAKAGPTDPLKSGNLTLKIPLPDN